MSMRCAPQHPDAGSVRPRRALPRAPGEFRGARGGPRSAEGRGSGSRRCFTGPQPQCTPPRRPPPRRRARGGPGQPAGPPRPRPAATGGPPGFAAAGGAGGPPGGVRSTHCPCSVAHGAPAPTCSSGSAAGFPFAISAFPPSLLAARGQVGCLSHRDGHRDGHRDWGRAAAQMGLKSGFQGPEASHRWFMPPPTSPALKAWPGPGVPAFPPCSPGPGRMSEPP